VRRAPRAAAVEDPDDAGAAEEVALRILTGAAQPAATLQRRLRQRGFSATAARTAVDRCRRRGYVDDAALAASLTARMRRAGRGTARIAAELRRRGVAAEIVESALGPVEERGDEAAALEVGRKLLDRELARARDDGGARRRLAGALQRRGFAAGVIAHTLRVLAEEART
jgi:regulatory protein